MILYSDEDIVAVNKKSGEFIQTKRDDIETLSARLEKEFGRLYIVHRLDAPASGIILFARHKGSAAALSKQFINGRVQKRYICAVDAAPPAESGRLENMLLIPSGKRSNKVIAKPYGENVPEAEGPPGLKTRRAVLDYSLLFKTERYWIIDINLKTGRKHQIRAQLAAAGCHIKGDVKYGARRTNPGGGIHLHALSLTIDLPSTGERTVLSAPLPDDPLWNSIPKELLPAYPEQ